MENKIKKRIEKLKQAVDFAEQGIVNLTRVQRIRILQEVEILEGLIKRGDLQ